MYGGPGSFKLNPCETEVGVILPFRFALEGCGGFEIRVSNVPRPPLNLLVPGESEMTDEARNPRVMRTKVHTPAEQWAGIERVFPRAYAIVLGNV